MTDKKIASYGNWKSPITADLIVSSSIGVSSPQFDRHNIYWLESRPSEAGRSTIVKLTPEGQTEDVIAPPFNVRTRVHEYGGGAFLVADDVVYFSNYADQRVYVQKSGASPQPLTPESKLRYADYRLDKAHNRLICVAEDHSNPNTEAENKLVTIDLTTGAVKTLVKGASFYTSPCLSGDGSKLAWLEWNHPYMPWDSTFLYLADVESDGSLSNITLIAGSETESICQPSFAPDGILYFSSDRTNWWNLYSQDAQGKIEAVYALEAEFGYPHWVFGETIYGFVDEQTIVTTYTQNGIWKLATIDIASKTLTNHELPFTNIAYLQVQGQQILFTGGSATQPTAIVTLNITTGDYQILKQSSNLEIDSGYLSQPQPIAFPTSNNQTAYAWYYPPQNKDFQAPEGELPPLFVKSHGGPTAMTTASYNLKIQYWTSRGFAFVDVNYGGSTGYGRDYRQRLYGQWGIVDVADCVNVAQFLAGEGKVDGNKLAISGGSAGGYTTLAALTFHDTFKAGASYYGVSDLTALATDTHKFESRYLDQLIGKYPEEKTIYEQRSPINYTEQLSCPVIFLQGLEDKVVPPNQAEMMFNALQAKGVTSQYITFPDEQHGFRKAENIKKAIDSEFNFYALVFGF